MFFKSNSNYELDISATYEKLPNRTLCSRHRKKQGIIIQLQYNQIKI
jgi:hypothetical protein